MIGVVFNGGWGSDDSLMVGVIMLQPLPKVLT